MLRQRADDLRHRLFCARHDASRCTCRRWVNSGRLRGSRHDIFTQRLEIAGRPIGPARLFVIAEIAQAHDSLRQAHAYIDAVASAGADAINKRVAHAESTPHERFRVHFSKQDATRYAYWKRMEFTPEQWRGLAAHARELGLVFLSSAFSDEAVTLLETLDMPAWKVGSGEITNTPLLERMARGGRPVLLSSGMSSYADLDAATSLLATHNVPVGLFQCTTSYPCPPERIGLNVMDDLRQRYGVPVGLSDHSARVETGLAAAALGADMLEVHVVFSPHSFGPDTTSSLTIEGLCKLVDGVRFIERIVHNPVDKEAMAAEVADLKVLFGKSVVAKAAMKAGTVLSRADLLLKKPGGDPCRAG